MNNRASIERVMGFCTKAEYEEFVETVLDFEQMLARSHNPMAPWTLVRANDKRLGRGSTSSKMYSAGFTTHTRMSG